MNNSDSTNTNRHRFAHWCECDDCVALIHKPELFANIISFTRDGERRHKIDTASPDHQHLNGMEFGDPFEALRLINNSGLTFIAWVG